MSQLTFRLPFCFDLGGNSHACSPINFRFADYLKIPKIVFRIPTHMQLSYNTGFFFIFWGGVILLKNDIICKTIYIINIQLDDFSRDEPTHVTSTQMKKQNITSPPEAPRAPFQSLHV